MAPHTIGTLRHPRLKKNNVSVNQNQDLLLALRDNMQPGEDANLGNDLDME